MEPSHWDVVVDIAIPVVAILVSTVIAISLARGESKRAERAREDERRDRVLEELIAAYTFFISASPTSETWSPYLRLIRAKLFLLQTFPTARVLAEWLASQGDEGRHAMRRALNTPHINTPESDAYAEDMRPMSEWADRMIHGIALWMRGDLTDEALREQIKAAS